MSRKSSSPLSAPVSGLRSSSPSSVKGFSSSSWPEHDALQPLPEVSLNHSESLLHAPSMESPSLSDSSIVPSPSFSPSSIGSSVSKESPLLSTPDPRAQHALNLHGDNTLIHSSPMAPLEGLPNLSALDGFSNSLGLEGGGFPAPKEQAVVVKSSDHLDTSSPTAGANSDANDDPTPAQHSLQPTLSLEHADSLRESLHGSGVHIHRGDETQKNDARASPIALNIIQHPYP